MKEQKKGFEWAKEWVLKKRNMDDADKGNVEILASHRLKKCKKHPRPRTICLAPEFDGLNCFETILLRNS